jgi:hypothetical protein
MHDMGFAERYGYRPTRLEIQVEDLDDETRTALWNVAYTVLLRKAESFSALTPQIRQGVAAIWAGHLKQRLDEVPDGPSRINKFFSTMILEAEWFDTLSFIEAAADRWPVEREAEVFRRVVNDILAANMSAYRFVGAEIIRITEPEQIDAVTRAQTDAESVPAAKTHLENAARLLNDRKEPDYANSIKESVSAVESVARQVTGNPKATLGDALKKVPNLHPAMRDAWLKMYGYTSDASGIRHASDGMPVNVDTALYFLVTCSAFVSYLLSTTVQLDDAGPASG